MSSIERLVEVVQGEEAKSLAEAERVLRELAQAGMLRDDHRVALGGGVVGDFAVGGFWTYVGATIVIWLVNLVIGAARRDIASSRARSRGADDLRY